MDTKKIWENLGGHNFRIPSDRQDKVYAQIKENSKGDFDFFILTVFSTIIITLGLIIDSGAVIIGGMLIAPMVWPVFMMSLAILMGRSRIFERSLFTLAKSTIVIFLVALVIGFLVPSTVLQSQEILARINPTLFELAIALASGFVGAFIVSYPKLGSAMAGVVVAAALVPPLAVTGLTVSQNNMEAAGGSLLLFFSNLIAITFASGVLFLIARFRGPATAEGKEVRKVNIRWFLVLLIVVLIPLFLITKQTLIDSERQQLVASVLNSEMPTAQITEVQITEENDFIVVNATLRSEDNLTKWQVTKLTEILSRSFKQSVVLKITVVPVMEAGKLVPPIETSSTIDINSTSSDVH